MAPLVHASFLRDLISRKTFANRPQAPLILIGHSMGGLVIKKAYILARQFQEFEALARRIRSIFFLATPHRGSDLAQMLSKILQITSGPRPFVADLNRNSLLTQSINDEFPQYSRDLQLFSFYETLPMTYGVGKALIVDKVSAVLGYANERTAYLNANHRDICKFTSQSDPNYITVRNALAATIDNFRSHASSSRQALDKKKRRLLDEFLAVTDAPEDDLLNVDSLRMSGSCEWLLKKSSFRSWRDGADMQIYWISGKPATGKSVLSGYVLNHIRALDQDYSFYFFVHGDTAKSGITSFLCSMAWQMASMHPEVLQTILDVCAKNDLLYKADYRIVWRKLFLDGILKLKISRVQYWIIDALDECRTGSELVPLLIKLDDFWPIRIFVTSRNDFETHRTMIPSKAKVLSEQICSDDTKLDISLYLEANIDCLPSENEKARQIMISRILEKSAGCFLWVRLVLQELRQVHTSTDIQQVLEDIPLEMDDLYSRILDAMSKAPYGKRLTKAILTWTVCAARPLTTSELYYALQIDIDDTIDSIQKSITTSCNQLVNVDAQSRVQMVHQTARDFLLRPHASEFSILKKEGHKRLAITCLQYLSGPEMKGPRHRKLSVSKASNERCDFVAYACNSLYEHIAHVSSTDDDMLMALVKFFTSLNVLSWIEYLARDNGLNRMIQTGKALRRYLQSRSKFLVPLGKEITVLDSWATDLVRLATKFGKHLSLSPSSIFNLILPFCPPDSAPRKQFVAPSRGIAVCGLSATTWDDCLSTIAYKDTPSALACCDRYFAVGLSSGQLIVYQDSTCQEFHTLQHQEPVKVVQFGRKGNVLASSGSKWVRVWDMNSWQESCKYSISHLCMSLSFSDDDKLLLGALKNNRLNFWDLTAGLLSDSIDWTEELEGQYAYGYRRPTGAVFSMIHNLLAIIYRGQDILLWDLERDTLYETYAKDIGAYTPRLRADATVWSLVFSSAPGSNLFAAAYSDGDLILFDTSLGTVREKTVANAQTLACSPDGRTLAAGDSMGIIQLYDFDALKLFYRIRLEEYGVKCQAFSGDSHKLIDIRGSQCRIWDPIVLDREDNDDEASDTLSISTTPQEICPESYDNVVLITALACHDNGQVFFCGREDGSVYLYDTTSGQQMQSLFNHAEGVSVTSLWFDSESNMLSSADSSSRVMTHRLSNQQRTWNVIKLFLDYRSDTSVNQLLSNQGHSRLLVCSRVTHTLWSITDTKSESIKNLRMEGSNPYRWATHPSNRNQLISISGTVAHLYEWKSLRQLTTSDGILLEGSILPDLSISSITSCFNCIALATTFSESTGPVQDPDSPFGTHATSTLIQKQPFLFQNTITLPMR